MTDRAHSIAGSIEPVPPKTRARDDIPVAYRWKLSDIFQNWKEWEDACQQLAANINAYGMFRDSLAKGADRLLEALQAADVIGQLSYRVYYYPVLTHDQDQRENSVDARRQLALQLLVKWEQASAWFKPELLAIPLKTVQSWFDSSDGLAVYRFALEEIYRQHEHVLDGSGEHLLALAGRLEGAASETYAALTTADMRFPEVTLANGENVTVTYGRYRAILAENRLQEDRAKAFNALYGCYESSINTYASLYNAVTQRDWFVAQARKYSSTLEAALHGNNIPTSVVESLITTARAGTEPLRRYHALRKRTLELDTYYLYDTTVPLVAFDKHYPYDEALEWIINSVAPLGEGYQEQLRAGLKGRWIDVYENDGKRSGAYSAGVYGVHPYMLLNYNDTLNDVFTLAHEMGHSMHTVLSHQTQPFIYSSYTIFVAEVASTLNEALLLDYMLKRSDDPNERVVLLQHAIDSICATFYTQVLFADWELQVHRLVERGEPVTADSLNALYRQLLHEYYGDDGAISHEEVYGVTWARIPHFFRSPYYVYQYATCFASSAKILSAMRDEDPVQREVATEHYLELLKSGGRDHPMTLLREAGADLANPETVQAVVVQLNDLVSRLEKELS